VCAVDFAEETVMTKQKGKKKRSIIISLLILGLIIVVFPLISLKYLTDGLDYRKNQLAALDELGSLSTFKAINLDGKSINNEGKGNVVLLSHEQLACDDNENQTLNEFVEKFKNQDVFRHVILTENADCRAWEESYIADIDNNKKLFEQYKLLIPTNDYKSHAMLSDRENQIRRVYDLTKKEDIELLITHTTVLMPPLKKRG